MKTRKVEHGKVTIQLESKVTDDGSDTKIVGARHKPYGNGDKPAE